MTKTQSREMIYGSGGVIEFGLTVWFREFGEVASGRRSRRPTLSTFGSLTGQMYGAKPIPLN